MNDRELEEALVGRLRLLAADEPDLSADVRAAQRARLVAMAAVRTPATRSPEVGARWWRRLLAARPDDAPASPWRTRVTAGLVGAAMTVGALSGLVAVAQGAEPGDLLYGLKRGSEQTQLALASDADRGLTLLTFASTRLTELTELTGEDAGALPAATVPGMPGAAGADAGTVVDVLSTMDEQTTEGTAAFTATAVPAGDAEALTVLSGWADTQRAGLVALDVPAGAGDALASSLALVDRVAARAADLQTALACPGGASEAGTDDLGPVPGACLPAPTPGVAPGSSSTPATTPAQPSVTGAPTTAAEPTAGGGAGGGTAGGGQGGGGQGGATGGGAPGGAATGGGATGGGAPGGATGGGAQTSAPAVPTIPLPLPTSAAPATSPLVQVPLPLPSTTVCVGGLICIGG